MYSLLFVKFDLMDAFETLLEMRLHTLWVFGFAEDFEEFIVAEEVEPREGSSLPLEVGIESLLDDLEDDVAFLEQVKQFLLLGEYE
jgi:hypothetical protein